MFFYRIETEVDIKKDPEEQEEDKSLYRHRIGLSDSDTERFDDIISEECEKLYQEIKKKCYINVNRTICIEEEKTFKKLKSEMTAVALSLDELNFFLEKLKSRIEYRLLNTCISETTYGNFRRSLGRRGCGDGEEDILRDFDLPDISNFSHILNHDEYLISKEDMTPEKYEEQAREFLCDSTLLPELKRIFAGNMKENAKGVPVQYLISIKNDEVRENVKAMLRDALYDAGRFQNSRMIELIYKNRGLFGPSDEDVNRATYGYYKLCKGGLAVLDYLKEEIGKRSNVKHAGTDTLEAIGECIKYHRNEVQTFLCVPGESPEVEKMLMEKLGNVPVVKIKEDRVKGEKAAEYLKILASKKEAEPDDKLFSEVNEAGTTYDVSELKVIFDRWYNDYIKTKVYPQYSVIATSEKEMAQKEPEGCAYAKLKKMTGLKNAKKVIDQALDFYKAQKLFKEKGMKDDRPAMHMVFTGNPGTAKTTVARLFAKILKENGILSKGDLFELGRSDLVGMYVGWTAPIVKKRFEEAKGSVLFIDEAYSLVDGKDGLYGDEAINTIVAEMENNREDMVVIFAGYPEEMNGFLEKNPGLRSRIAFHVPFEDYDVNELYSIAELISEDKGMRLDPAVKAKLMPIFEKAAGAPDFGNGRFVRNMIEKAKMKQASRLVRGDVENVTKTEIETLTADDFEEPEDTEKKQRSIGFAV